MTTKLADWIVQELNNRGWSIRELARRSELAHATINAVLRDRSKPGINFCIGITRAFRVPPEQVFRLAGLLPTIPSDGRDAQRKQQFDDYWKYLTSEDRRTLTTLSRIFFERQVK